MLPDAPRRSPDAPPTLRRTRHQLARSMDTDSFTIYIYIHIYGPVPLISSHRRGHVSSFAYGQGCPVRGTTAQERVASKQPATSKKKIKVHIEIPGPCRESSNHVIFRFRSVASHQTATATATATAIATAMKSCLILKLGYEILS